MRWWRQADPRQQQRRRLIRGAAYAILTCTAAFALAQVIASRPRVPPARWNSRHRRQAPTWQAAVTNELRRGDVAKMLDANPALQIEALDLLNDNFARPRPPAPGRGRGQGLQAVLASLQDKYTRVVSGAGDRLVALSSAACARARVYVCMHV